MYLQTEQIISDRRQQCWWKVVCQLNRHFKMHDNLLHLAYSRTKHCSSINTIQLWTYTTVVITEFPNCFQCSSATSTPKSLRTYQTYRQNNLWTSFKLKPSFRPTPSVFKINCSAHSGRVHIHNSTSAKVSLHIMYLSTVSKTMENLIFKHSKRVKGENIFTLYLLIDCRCCVFSRTSCPVSCSRSMRRAAELDVVTFILVMNAPQFLHIT